MFCTLNGCIENAKCSECKYGKISCIFRHDKYGDAERLVISDTHHKEAYIKAMDRRKRETRLGPYSPVNKETTRLSNTQSVTIQPKEKTKCDNEEILLLLAGIGVSFVIAFPVAYLFPILTIFSDFLFSSAEVFMGTNDPLGGLATEYKDTFFFSEYGRRYVYCFLLMSTFWAWAEGSSKNAIVTAIQVTVTILFVTVAFLNINLLLGTIFGPLVIVFGLLFTAKR